MAYDEHLANRLRELLAEEEAITEKKMFGGLAFLLHGNMSVSASRNGGLLVRIDPADTDASLARPHVALMEMGRRTMEGWITVAPEGLRTKRELAGWVTRSITFAKTLRPKEAARLVPVDPPPRTGEVASARGAPVMHGTVGQVSHPGSFARQKAIWATGGPTNAGT
jgi:TfoX/Sxy family transcriptional regulator of competence genes